MPDRAYHETRIHKGKPDLRLPPVMVPGKLAAM